ncbi:hypothetical protein FGO68_gene2744 [Halteria grandinella]|uniref:Uncharacterized protein n=1 Tax=Halteria grandinella TaxID=5974 RepID=A0A8J8SWF9_HALGN|nr:hypothetical protein FGO68_gene2744 [Halteria grandinella]
MEFIKKLKEKQDQIRRESAAKSTRIRQQRLQSAQLRPQKMIGERPYYTPVVAQRHFMKQQVLKKQRNDALKEQVMEQRKNNSQTGGIANSQSMVSFVGFEQNIDREMEQSSSQLIEADFKRFAPVPSIIPSGNPPVIVQQVQNDTMITFKASKTSELYEPSNNEAGAVSQRSVIEQEAPQQPHIENDQNTHGSPYSAIQQTQINFTPGKEQLSIATGNHEALTNLIKHMQQSQHSDSTRLGTTVTHIGRKQAQAPQQSLLRSSHHSNSSLGASSSVIRYYQGAGRRATTSLGNLRGQSKRRGGANNASSIQDIVSMEEDEGNDLDEYLENTTTAFLNSDFVKMGQRQVNTAKFQIGSHSIVNQGSQSNSNVNRPKTQQNINFESNTQNRQPQRMTMSGGFKRPISSVRKVVITNKLLA